MKPAEKVLAWALAVGMVIGLIWGPAEHTVQAAERTGETLRNVESATPTWSGGAAVGFLSNTPDGTAVALNLHADRFLHRNVSLGPLLQLGFTGDLTQVGFSGQGKYWIDLPQTDNRAKLVLQAGIGFVHAEYFRNDTSFLISLGIGVDYAMTRALSFTGTFLLNFTDLDTGPGSNTNVMPGLTFGSGSNLCGLRCVPTRWEAGRPISIVVRTTDPTGESIASHHQPQPANPHYS